MKNKLLLICAVGFITILSTPVFSQTSTPVGKKSVYVRVQPVSKENKNVSAINSSPANSGSKPSIHSRVQPVTNKKGASPKPVVASNNSKFNKTNIRVKPVSAQKEPGSIVH